MSSRKSGGWLMGPTMVPLMDPTAFLPFAHWPDSGKLARKVSSGWWGAQDGWHAQDWWPVKDWWPVQLRAMQLAQHSAQTIALRFMLAPPWLGWHPWVRNEWMQMSAEKPAALFDACMRGWMSASIAPWNPDSARRILDAALGPFSERTKHNSTRLGDEAMSRVMGMPIGGMSGRSHFARPARRRR